MGIELAKAFVSVRANTGQLAGDFTRAKPQVMNAARGLAGSVNRILATIGVGIGIAAVFSSIRRATSLAERQIKAEQRVAAVVRGTGMAAGFTAKELMKQASALQAVTTIGDEEILELQAVILTFRKITGDTFEQTTELALDLAEAMQTDAKSGALQLSKALQDPLRGVTALTRSGVTFTDQQKETIKNLVESNQLYKAQALILAEVRGQVGGVAREMALTDLGKLTQAKNILGDMREEMGRKLIPLQTMFVNLQIKFLALTFRLGGAWGKVKDALKIVWDTWKEIFKMWGIDIKGLGDDIGKFVEKAVNSVAEFVLDTAEWFNVFVKNSDKTWELFVALVKLAVSRSWDFFKRFWEHLSQIARASLMSMDVGLRRWIELSIKALDRLLKAFDIIGIAVIKIWNSVWSGLGEFGRTHFEMMGVVFKQWVKQQIAGLRLLLISYELTISAISKIQGAIDPSIVEGLPGILGKIGKVTAEASSELGRLLREQAKDTVGVYEDMISTFKDETKGIDLFGISEESRNLVKEVARLFGELAAEKLLMEMRRKKLVPEKVAEEEVVRKIAAGAGIGVGTGVTGRFGFAEYGRALQDMFLKAETPQEIIAKEAVQQTKLLKDIDARLSRPGMVEAAGRLA